MAVLPHPLGVHLCAYRVQSNHNEAVVNAARHTIAGSQKRRTSLLSRKQECRFVSITALNPRALMFSTGLTNWPAEPGLHHGERVQTCMSACGQAEGFQANPKQSNKQSKQRPHAPPALFTRPSMRPILSSANCTRARISSSLRTLHWNACACAFRVMCQVPGHCKCQVIG